MKRAFLLISAFLVFSAMAGGLAYFQFHVKPAMIAGFIKGAPRPVQSVAVVLAREEEWTPKTQQIGSLRAVHQMDVAAQIGGIIRAIKFDTADDVEKGALLLEIDDSTEQAELKANLAAQRNADAALERMKQLQTSGAASQSAFDSALAARDSASANAERTRAIIAQKSLRAPFSGRLGIRRVDLGQYISPGTPLVSLQSLDPIFIDFQAPEQMIAALKLGQTLEARVDAYPSETFKGRVKFLDARINMETRQFLARGEIDNKDKRLRPGMFANISIAIGPPRAQIALPRTAIDYSLYGDSVYVAIPEAKDSEFARIERRFIRVGETEGDLAAIADGVKAGEIVVSAGQIKLRPDMRVKMVWKPALTPLTPSPRE